jgi:2-polyprenyl-3-methyl-5-hydroxy-6-metoxy-1,4-benzoquinol methylase
MLGLAREKVQQAHVQFQQGDMNSPWTFASGRYDLVVFSLVLEHIEDLASLFKRMAAVLKPGALVYIGELHPFKQYGGSKARFETAEGTEYVTCYTHHVSDFTGAAQAAGLQLLQLREYFDEGNREAPPRILALLFTYTP